MEDMARLAMVEQRVRDMNKFRYILYELLQNINHILENIHDYYSRQIKSEVLKNVIAFQELNDYLGYIGFRWVSGTHR